jgi:hypothetical protein
VDTPKEEGVIDAEVVEGKWLSDGLLHGTPDEAAVLVYCVRYMPELVVAQLQQNMLVAHARVYDPFEL